MNSYTSYLHLFFLSISGMLLLCTAFAADSSLVNGIVTGKVHWFHLMMVFFTASFLLTGFTTRKKQFAYTIPDGLILLLTGIVLATYNWQLNPEPEKLIFGGQLVVLWFMLRSTLNTNPSLKLFFLSIIMCTGLLEAIWGAGQLHGLSYSNHTLFRLTGSFFNPGPFSGYLAMALPICLGFVLRFGKKRKPQWWQGWNVFYYFSWISMLVILIVLPAGMSRSAWIAAAVSCVWIYWVQEIGWMKTKETITKHRKIAAIGFIITALLLGGALAGIYLMKKDSANGRLLMWKITAKTMAEQPWTGTGLGGFPAAYAEAQANYFASEKASETEKLVAGSPEYAFNEYLQIGLEEGIGGLVVFLSWIGFSFYNGVRNRQFGAVGGLLSLALFAFSSYPLQLPSFWVIMIFLSAIANTRTAPVREGKIYVRIIFTLVLTGASIGLFLLQKDYYDSYKKWNTMKLLYNNKAYEVVLEDYEKLHPILKHKPEFLFEQAQCLGKTTRYAEANILLERAIQLSADPMLYYIMAKNEQSLGHFKEAERLLLYGIDILPERLYPYYLLTKLYAEPDFYQKEKLQAAAREVMYKEPKVQSTAIREMREEVEKMLKSL